jgi:hypothetical protein
MSRIKCFGWNPSRLYRNLTVEQLGELRRQVEADPKSANPMHGKGSIYLYTPAARRKLDAIAWAITYHLEDKKPKEKSDV